MLWQPKVVLHSMCTTSLLPPLPDRVWAPVKIRCLPHCMTVTACLSEVAVPCEQVWPPSPNHFLYPQFLAPVTKYSINVCQGNGWMNEQMSESSELSRTDHNSHTHTQNTLIMTLGLPSCLVWDETDHTVRWHTRLRNYQGTNLIIRGRDKESLLGNQILIQ